MAFIETGIYPVTIYRPGTEPEIVSREQLLKRHWDNLPDADFNAPVAPFALSTKVNRKSKKAKTRRTVQCAACLEDFQTEGRNISVCKKLRCRIMLNRAGGVEFVRAEYLKQHYCLLCGEEFDPRASHVKFCGKPCNKDAYDKKQREALKAKQRELVQRQCDLCKGTFDVTIRYAEMTKYCGSRLNGCTPQKARDRKKGA